MPEIPTPAVNGQATPTVGGSGQGPSSISSFAPAATIEGCAGSIATLGSFWRLFGKCSAGLPTVTRLSPEDAPAAGARSATVKPIARTVESRVMVDWGRI